jgi:diadenylate cyclase
VIDLLQQVWKPAVEILIMAVGLYYGYILIRGTKGAPVVTGFLVLLLTLTFITLLLDLTVLRWMLTTFFAFLMVAILILFQPELRRILAELGSTSLFTSAHEQRENIEVIVQTCERLSEARIGALIAIEQTIHLHDAVESGLPVDCEATPEMLETIFFPNNAIHDGGVLITGDRIAFAACIFPLTQQKGLSPSLGTRHRAAIGLSEETDGIVVVVSEENGAISVAFRGQLTRGMSLEQLRAYLSGLLVKSKPANWLGSLREWLQQRFRPTPPAAVKQELE